MYAITHNGTAYGPDGIIKDVEGTPLAATDAADYNAQLEAQELAHIQTHPERLMLYVKHPARVFNGPGMCGPVDSAYNWEVTTWPGTVVSSAVLMGASQRVGFGYHSTRRAMSACISGQWYNGWYFESSGDYCRLKLAKRNPITGKPQE